MPWQQRSKIIIVKCFRQVDIVFFAYIYPHSFILHPFHYVNMPMHDTMTLMAVEMKFFEEK